MHMNSNPNHATCAFIANPHAVVYQEVVSGREEYDC